MLVETSAKFTPGSVMEFELVGPDTTLVVPARFVRSEVAAANALGVKYYAAAVFGKKLQLPGLFGAAGGLTPKALADLLTHVLTDQRGGPHTSLRGRFELGLLELVPARQIQITDVPVKPEQGAESICFSVPSPVESRAMLQITFESGYKPHQIEFNFLRAAAALAGVILR